MFDDKGGHRLMRTITLICAVSLLLLSACASVNTKLYDPAGLKAVDAWVLEFAYEAGSVEHLSKSSGDSELKVISEGHLPRDLQLRDDLYYTLKDEYAIKLTKTATEASGRIQIHPIHFYRGGFKLLTVTLVDKQGETLVRLKIKNGDRNATFKDSDEFTGYAAKAIADAIRQR
jgi:outer membrane lipoprotein-sorting protein